MRKFLKISLYTVLTLLILFSVLPYFFSVDTLELARDERPFTNSHFIVANKTRIHYRVWMPQKVEHKVFFIHGFSGSTFCWRNNIAPLVAKNSLVVAIDLPAFGFSDKGDTADYRADNAFNAVNAIMSVYDDSLMKGPWDMVGHSMGAFLSGQYASNYPEKIHSLTLIDGSPANVDAATGVGNTWFKYPPLLRWADVVARRVANPTTFSELITSGYSRKADSVAIYGYLQPFLYAHSGSAIFRMAAAQTDIGFKADNLKRLKIAILWGDDDQWLSIRGMKNFLEKYPHTKGYVIKGGGHCTMETQADQINAVLQQQISQ